MRKDKPTTLYREEITYPEGDLQRFNATRSTHDEKKFESWRTYARDHASPVRTSRFFTGTIEWREVETLT